MVSLAYKLPNKAEKFETVDYLSRELSSYGGELMKTEVED